MASPQPHAEYQLESRGPNDESTCRLQKYLQIEEEFCAAGDYVAMFSESTCSPNLVWREMVCKWSYDVVDMIGEARSVVYVTMNILDRFSAVAEVPMNEKCYECASMTALFLAARVAGTCNLQMTDLIQMSRDDGVQLQDIIATGKQMLNVLTWGHRLVTPSDFLQAMLQSLPSSVAETRRAALFESASFLAEISVCDIYLSRFPASQVAFAAIMNATYRERLLTNAELKAFCLEMEQKAALVHSSLDTRTIRSRLDSVYNRIEDNHVDAVNGPHYISDDEAEDEDEHSANYCKHSPDSSNNDDDCYSHVAQKRPIQPLIDQEPQSKRTRRHSLRQS